MAGEKNRAELIPEAEYAKEMRERVLPFLKEHVVPEIVPGAGDKPLMTFRWDAEHPRGTVVLLHGFTECAEKLSELIWSLLRNGFSVLTLDQRGHGASWRDERIRDLSRTHVDRFEDYVEDLRRVCARRLEGMPEPRYLFGHSMGGAVACAFLEDHPGVFAKAALCAPMIAPLRGGLPLWAGEALCGGAKLLGRGRDRVFFSKPWAGPEDFATSCATSRSRFEWYDALRTATPRFQNNGPTYSWTLEAFRVTKRLLAPGKPEGIRIPVRLYTAEDDNQVSAEEQERIAGRMPFCVRKVVPGARHEIYRSTDAVLFPWWQEILDFFEDRG